MTILKNKKTWKMPKNKRKLSVTNYRSSDTNSIETELLSLLSHLPY